jgi:hypothetical protein
MSDVRKPNILVIMADQMTPFLLDVCGAVGGARMANLTCLSAL